MNDKGVVNEYVQALNTVARFTSKDHPLREEVVELVKEEERGGDVSKHMRNVKFQCLKCKEVFKTEKQYRVHVGMNKHCGRLSPDDSEFESIRDQMNIIRPGP